MRKIVRAANRVLIPVSIATVAGLLFVVIFVQL